MNEPARHHRYTYREYVVLERFANVKHEYLDGEIYAMAGGTPEHAALAAAVSGALFAQMRGGPCRAYSSDLSVRVVETGLATYPDVTVVCGELERDLENRDAAINPKLVVEVTSDSTESYDRTTKLAHYQRIPSLEAVLLVSHRERRFDVWVRAAEGTFSSSSFGPGEAVRIPALGVTLAVDDVYGDLALRPAGTGVAIPA